MMPSRLRLHDHRIDRLLRLIHRELRLLALLDQHRHRRLTGRRVPLDVLFELRQPAARLFERQLVLTRLDRAQQLVARDIQLRLPHVEPRRQQIHFVTRDLHRRIGIELLDLELRFEQLRALLDQLVLVIRRIERHHDLAGRHRASGRLQRDQPELSAHGRRGQRGRLRRLQFAGGMNARVDFAAQHARGRDAGVLRPQLRPSGPHADECAGKQRERNSELNDPAAIHRVPPAGIGGADADPPAAAALGRVGSPSATRSPAFTPLAIATCS